MKKTLLTLGFAITSFSLSFAGDDSCCDSADRSSQSSRAAATSVKPTGCGADECCEKQCPVEAKAKAKSKKSKKAAKEEARRAMRDAFRQAERDTVTYSARGGAAAIGTVSGR